MSTSAQNLERIISARDALRIVAADFGIALSDAQLMELSEAFGSIVNRGTISAEIKEGESYSIQRGYYKGGTVRSVSGGGNYTLQSKGTVTPTKSKQTITPDSGYYGLSSVEVGAIPSDYVKPSGTKSITENGTHDVTSFASVEVNVAGSGGGGVVETCTVTVSDTGEECPLFAITTVAENGAVMSYDNIRDITDYENLPRPPYTISNVVCGSTIAILAPEAETDVPYAEVDGGAKFIKAHQVGWASRTKAIPLMFLFVAPETPGAHATIVASYT